MKRRSFIKSSIGLGLSWSGVQAAERAEQPENRSTVPERHPLKPNPAPSDKPHILLIMTDQQRGDALGCMGNPYIIEVSRCPYPDWIHLSGQPDRNGRS